MEFVVSVVWVVVFVGLGLNFNLRLGLLMAGYLEFGLVITVFWFADFTGLNLSLGFVALCCG